MRVELRSSQRPCRSLSLLLLVIMAGILIVPTAVKAASGGLFWAKSEQIGTRDQQANGAAVDSSGVYVVGFDANLSSFYYEWRVEKRDLATGTPLWAFSEQISTSGGNDAANAVAVDGTGVYIVGYDSASSNGHFEWRIEKRDLSTGSFISTFGTNGAVSEHISNRDDTAYGVAVDGTGLYVVGYDENTAGNLAEWRIEKRDLSTGALVWSVSEHISTANDVASGVAVDSTGVYVVGYDQNTSGNSNEWRIEKRDLTSGALITTFGVGGAISEHISTAMDQANGITLDSTGLYVVGYDQNTSGNWDEWRIEKRDLTSGSTIWAVSEHISPYRDDANAVTDDSTGLYIVGKDENSPSYPEWSVEKRNLTTGGTIWTVSEDISTNAPGNQAYAVAIDNTGLYVGGSDSAVGNGYAEWRIEKRILGDQTLITGVSSGSGTVNPNCAGPTGCSTDVGSPISVTATPSSGSLFLSWIVSGASCSGGSSINPCTFTMPNNAVTVSATFTSKVTMTVSYSVVDGGNPSPPVFNYVRRGVGENVTLTGTPTGISVDKGSLWSVTTNPLQDSTSSERWWTSQPTKGTASGSRTIVFHYNNQLMLTMKASPTSGGSVTPHSGWENSSASVNIQATPSSNYAFLSWIGVGTGSYTGTNNPVTLTMNGPITETANFQRPLSVSLVSPKNGTILTSSPVTLNVTVADSIQGATVTIFLDGNKVCSGSTNSSGSFACKHTVTKTGGTHSWYAMAAKTGFTSGTSPTWTFTF